MYNTLCTTDINIVALLPALEGKTFLEDQTRGYDVKCRVPVVHSNTLQNHSLNCLHVTGGHNLGHVFAV